MINVSTIIRLLVHIRDRPEDLIATVSPAVYLLIERELLTACRRNNAPLVSAALPFANVLVRGMPVRVGIVAENALEIAHHTVAGEPRYSGMRWVNVRDMVNA